MAQALPVFVLAETSDHHHDRTQTQQQIQRQQSIYDQIATPKTTTDKKPPAPLPTGDTTKTVSPSDVSGVIKTPPVQPGPETPKKILAPQTASFATVFESVFDPSGVYTYQGMPKPINTALIAVGALSGLSGIGMAAGLFNRKQI